MVFFYVGAFLLMLLGICIVMVKKNITKIVMGITLMVYGICFMFIIISSRVMGTTPYFINRLENSIVLVDPVPQVVVALILLINTAIISICLYLNVKLGKQYSTLDYDKIKEADKK